MAFDIHRPCLRRQPSLNSGSQRGGAAPEALISPLRKPGTVLGPIPIFNVALADRASRLYSSRAKKNRKLLVSACSGRRQRRRLRFAMAVPPDLSTLTQRKQRKSAAPSL